MTAAWHRLDSGCRTDRDDRPAVACLDHRRHHRLDRVEHAGEVDVDDVLPLLCRNLPQPAPIEHPGVVHHDVETAELLDRVGDQTALAFGVAHVDFAGQDLPAFSLDQRHRLGKILRGGGRVSVVFGHGCAGVQRDDVRSGAGQTHAVRAALPARGSGDVGDPSGQRGGHLRLLAQALVGGAHAGCSSGSAGTRTLVNS